MASEGASNHQQGQAGAPRLAQHLAPLLLAQLDLVEVLAQGMAVHHQQVGPEELELDAVGAHLEGRLQHLQHAASPVGGSHLCEHEAWLAVAEGTRAELEGGRVHGR
jgi:hypothetical protein